MDKREKTNDELRKSLGKKILSVTVVVLVVALSIALFLFFRQNPENIEGLESYGYAGAFLISLVSTATVILPAPGVLLLIAIGAICNPILVGLVGAAGGSIGELSGYVLGRGGRGFANQNRILLKAEGWMKKRGFLTVFLFSLIPFLPFDIVGIVAGALRFPIWKFLLASFIGKTILYIILIQAGSWGWDALLRFIY